VVPTVVAHLKQRVGHELHSLLGVGVEPFAAGEKGGFDPLGSQVIDDLSIIPGDLPGPFAQVKGQGRDLAVLQGLDPADGVLPPGRKGGQRGPGPGLGRGPVMNRKGGFSLKLRRGPQLFQNDPGTKGEVEGNGLLPVTAGIWCLVPDGLILRHQGMEQKKKTGPGKKENRSPASLHKKTTRFCKKIHLEKGAGLRAATVNGPIPQKAGSKAKLWQQCLQFSTF